MPSDAAYEVYLFTNGAWRPQSRLTAAEGGRERAVRLAESELRKGWVEGAVVMRDPPGPDAKVFRRVKRADLPPLGATQRAGLKEDAARRTATRRSAGETRAAAPPKEDRSLMTMLSGLASRVAELATDAKPVPPAPRRPAAPEAAPGTAAVERIGRYDIIAELGTGAMGVVYQAYDPVIDRLVAIKTIDKRKVDDEGDALPRLRREAQSAGRLSHPNVVSIYDYGENDRLAYIAMEFVDGRPLNRILAERRLAPAEAAAILRQLLLALEYSHGCKVVHRDIKPANILVMAGGAVKITDFGIARVETSTLTQTGAFLGTPAYMSPEQVKGVTADARSDIFSAGVVFYEMLTGERPFSGSGATLVYQILHGVPQWPSPQDGGGVPAVLAEVVARAMAKEPEDRFATIQDFLRALDAAADRLAAAPEAPPRAEATAQARKPWYDRRTYAAGTEVFHEGDAGDACYVVETGLMEVVKTDPDTGRDVVLATVGRGAVVGEMALIDNQSRMATLRAVEDTVLLTIPRKAFQARLDKLDPVTRRLLDTFSQRIRALSDEVVRLNAHRG